MSFPFPRYDTYGAARLDRALKRLIGSLQDGADQAGLTSPWRAGGSLMCGPHARAFAASTGEGTEDVSGILLHSTVACGPVTCDVCDAPLGPITYSPETFACELLDLERTGGCTEPTGHARLQALAENALVRDDLDKVRVLNLREKAFPRRPRTAEQWAAAAEILGSLHFAEQSMRGEEPLEGDALASALVRAETGGVPVTAEAHAELSQILRGALLTGGDTLRRSVAVADAAFHGAVVWLVLDLESPDPDPGGISGVLIRGTQTRTCIWNDTLDTPPGQARAVRQPFRLLPDGLNVWFLLTVPGSDQHVALTPLSLLAAVRAAEMSP